MKKLLQRWLEIPKHSEYETTQEIRREVTKALEQGFSPTRDSDWYVYWGTRSPLVGKVQGLVGDRIKEKVEKEVSSQMSKWIDTRLEPEHFIDEVVERIKRKQV